MVAKGFSSGSNTRVPRSKYPQITLHKTDPPDVVLNLLDADRLAGKDGAEVNLLISQTEVRVPRAFGFRANEGLSPDQTRRNEGS